MGRYIWNRSAWDLWMGSVAGIVRWDQSHRSLGFSLGISLVGIGMFGSGGRDRSDLSEILLWDRSLGSFVGIGHWGR